MRFPFRVVGIIELHRHNVSHHRKMEAAQRAARREARGGVYGYGAQVEEYVESEDYWRPVYYVAS